MFDLSNSNPIEIKVTIGMLQEEEVCSALGKLISAMGKAQEKINVKIEQEMCNNPNINPFRRGSTE